MRCTISNVIVEHRPLIQCINAFITFTSNLPAVESVKIQFNDGEFVVQITENDRFHLKFGQHFGLKPQTLSSLSVNHNFLSFRVNTNPSNVPIVGPQYSKTNVNLAVNLKTAEKYRVLCSNCDAQLGGGLFNRILELPSDSLDVSEWFCCNHKHNDRPKFPGVEETGREKTNSNRFSPKIDEILFGNFYALFNRSLFEATVDCDSLVSCQRCSHVLGEMVRRTSALKIWNENLKFASEAAEVLHLFDCVDLYDNFAFIVRRCLAFETQMGFPGPSRLLLEAKITDGASKFLLLQIMDKNLQVFQAKLAESNQIELQTTSTVKVMFQLLSHDDETLKMWQNESTVNEMQISPALFEAARNRMTHNSTLTPEIHRFFDGFTITYLNL